MSFELVPKTKAGERVAQIAADLIPGFRARADEADRTGNLAAENFQELQSTKIAAAFVPDELGGLGLTSVHDWLLLIATLARGDASTAIAINMHLGVSRGMALAYRDAKEKGHSTESVEQPLRAIAQGKMLICATATERSTDNLHPMTEAARTDEGWEINGNKQFVTMSPVATHLAMNLRVRDEGEDFLANTLLPINTPGIHPNDDWDALGMRGSGSQSIDFKGVQVASHAVRKTAPWGQWSTSVIINRTIGNLALVAAYLGIAEYARELALAAVQKQKKLGEPVSHSAGVQQMFGELDIELAQCQSIMQVTGKRTDEWLAQSRETAPTFESAHHLMRDYQCAKWVVNRGAIDIVNRALDLVGGSGFMASNPMTRLYRDVRAGPFMQPLGATELRGYVGKVALARYPNE